MKKDIDDELARLFGGDVIASRVRGVLCRNGVHTVEQFCALPVYEFKDMRGVGDALLERIHQARRGLGASCDYPSPPTPSVPEEPKPTELSKYMSTRQVREYLDVSPGYLTALREMSGRFPKAVHPNKWLRSDIEAYARSRKATYPHLFTEKEGDTT